MSDYLLGHGAEEWRRLTEQHALWRETLLPSARVAGVESGASVLEVGCGPGDLLVDLADLVGPTGSVVGIERDDSAVRVARARAADKPWVQLRVGDVAAADLGGPYDVIVARWVLHLLPRPAEIVKRLASVLVPGGALVVQDYDHDGLRLFPRRRSVEACIDAFREAYRAKGADLWVAGRLPRLYADAGLSTERIDPCVRAGGPESACWRWVERFLFQHLETVQRSGHIDATARAEFERDWSEIKDVPGATLFTPMQVTVVGRKPI